jgi:leucine-rich PPR motif-containing protein
MKKSMVEKGLVPDCYTHVTLVNGYCMEQRLREAKLVLSEMSDVGLKLDLIGYSALIDGFVNQFDV